MQFSFLWMMYIHICNYFKALIHIKNDSIQWFDNPYTDPKIFFSLFTFEYIPTQE